MGNACLFFSFLEMIKSASLYLPLMNGKLVQHGVILAVLEDYHLSQCMK